jgi:hypothetical protein
MVRSPELINPGAGENRAIQATKLAQEKLDKLDNILRAASAPIDIWNILKPLKILPEEPVIEEPSYPLPPELTLTELPEKPSIQQFKTNQANLSFDTKEPHIDDNTFWSPELKYLRALIFLIIILSPLWITLMLGSI